MPDHKRTLPDHLLFNHNRDHFWVFAYGSLMWRPDFDFNDRQPATLKGYCRALCIYSWFHRGTREIPGLIFGLDKGGHCDGFAFQIPAHAQEATVAMLRQRELVRNVYQETLGTIELTGENPRTVQALFYTAVQDHEQYTGPLDHEEQARLIKQGVGKSGINTEYVLNTHDHLVREGIRDDNLTSLCKLLNDTR